MDLQGEACSRWKRGDERMIGDCKSNLAVEFEMKDLGLMHYSGLGGLEERWMLLHWTGEVCSRYPEEIQDGGLQAYGHTSSFQLEED